MRDDGTLDEPNAPLDPIVRTDDRASAERTMMLRRLRAAAPALSAAARNAGPRLRGARDRARQFATTPGRARIVLATGVLCCLGLATYAQTNDETAGVVARVDPLAAHSQLVQRAEQERASRSLDRAPSAQAAAPTTAEPSASTGPDADPDVRAKKKPAEPAPVAGLTRTQMRNAEVIVRTGRDMGVPRRGLVIAVATAMQESNLYNLASGVIPESQRHPHQGLGWDHDSVGLFQQRSASGWGPVDRLMDPEFATRQFLGALEQVPGWQQMRLTDAAQAVQVSAYPDHYAKHEWRASEVVDAVLSTGR
ncbi:peptidase M23 [Micromonospora musae]|uniref:peptidase M23 n=1 Tax=Micromonospora musae TaxID=1894970 RepID=UPI0033DF851B